MLLKPLKPLPEPWKPHEYQKKAIRFLLKHAAGALFLDPGLGKTSILLACIKLLKQKKIIDKVLLIAPVRVCYNVWPKEINKWTDFNGLKYVILHGPKKDELLQEEADIYIINPEGLDWLLGVEKIKITTKTGRVKTQVRVDMRRWKKLGFDTLVIDELSKFKHQSSNRFKSLKLVLRTFRRRWGLTGSPAANGLLDLFGQCYILDEGNALGQYVTHYRRNYFNPSYDGYSWVLKEGADDKIYKRLAPLALRMDADDYLKMPKVVENNIYVDLPPEAYAVYSELEDELIAQIADKTVVAANSGVASIKCRQVAGGSIFLDPEIGQLVKVSKKREWVTLHDEKIYVLESLIEELQGSPLIVAYHFKHELARLLEHFGKDTPVIGSGVAAKKTDKIIEQWNTGKMPLLFVHPQSAAHGLDGLQYVGSHVCLFAMTFDYDHYDQLIRRLRRQGNKSARVFVHHIMARGTVDEQMYEALKSKRHGQNAFFAALKKLARGRK